MVRLCRRSWLFRSSCLSSRLEVLVFKLIAFIRMITTALRQGSSLTAEHGEAKLPTIDASAPRAVEVGEVTTLFLGLGFEGLGFRGPPSRDPNITFCSHGEQMRTAVRCHGGAWHMKPGMMRWKGQPDTRLSMARSVCCICRVLLVQNPVVRSFRHGRLV